MTLKEFAEHPERASEEEVKTMNDALQHFKEVCKKASPLIHGVTLESGRSKEEIAHSYYVEVMLMAAILESFITVNEQEYKDINKFVFNYTDKAFIWDVSIIECITIMKKLCAIGLLKPTNEDKYNPSFVITVEGREALRLQTYPNLAQTALFNLKTQQLNDKTLELSKRAVRQNWMMLVVAIASVIVAFFSFIITLMNR